MSSCQGKTLVETVVIKMMDLKQQIDKARLPRHIAIIMDGNGRWAKKQGLARMFGHKQGVQTVHDITVAATELGRPDEPAGGHHRQGDTDAHE